MKVLREVLNDTKNSKKQKLSWISPEYATRLFTTDGSFTLAKASPAIAPATSGDASGSGEGDKKNQFR